MKKRTKRLGLIVAGVLLLALMLAGGAAADGRGCTDADVGSIVGATVNSATYDAGDDIITGVCIKSGSAMFDSTGHSGILVDGIYEDGCYEVSGVGTSEVAVVRIGAANLCQGISHIDVYAEPPPVIELFVGCAGWRVFVDGERVDIGFWAFPFVLEEAESDYWEVTINEPAKCLIEPEYTLENTCLGWAIYDQFQTLVDEGPWTLPFELEIAASTFVDYLILEPEECLVPPDGVIVGVSLGCGVPDGYGVVHQLQGGIAIDPEGGATVTFDGIGYTENTSLWPGFGEHEWSALANAGFILIGDDEGLFEINRLDCNIEPPIHPPTGTGDVSVAAVLLLSSLGVGGVITGVQLLRKRDA